jgi:hypothetical protein
MPVARAEWASAKAEGGCYPLEELLSGKTGGRPPRTIYCACDDLSPGVALGGLNMVRLLTVKPQYFTNIRIFMPTMVLTNVPVLETTFHPSLLAVTTATLLSSNAAAALLRYK